MTLSVIIDEYGCEAREGGGGREGGGEEVSVCWDYQCVMFYSHTGDKTLVHQVK